LVTGIAEVLFATTGWLVLRWFGIKSASERVATWLGLDLWIVVGTIILVLLR
jgi:hypothetical protein